MEYDIEDIEKTEGQMVSEPPAEYGVSSPRLTFNEVWNHLVELPREEKQEVYTRLQIVLREEDTLRSRFEKHYRQWWEEICVLSNPNQIVANPHFKAIVAMGRDAVPFIVEKIEETPSDLVKALGLIYNKKLTKSPVNISTLCQLWIKEIRLSNCFQA